MNDKTDQKNFRVLLTAVFVFILSVLITRANPSKQDLTDSVKVKECQTQPKCQEGTLCMTNPASTFCECMGGALEIRDNSQGQYGVCKINGTEVDEWEYYRSMTVSGETTDISPSQLPEAPLGKEQAEEAVKNLDEIKKLQTQNPKYVVQGEGMNETKGVWSVHVYEIVDEHTATYNWYYVNIKTGEVTREFNF